MRFNGYRTLTSVLNGSKDLGVAALGATNKMYWSETHRDTLKLAMDILGMAGDILTGSNEDEAVAGMGRRVAERDYPVNSLQALFFFSRSETIWGGNRRDPAQHRGRAGARTAQGTEGGDHRLRRLRVRAVTGCATGEGVPR